MQPDVNASRPLPRRRERKNTKRALTRRLNILIRRVALDTGLDLTRATQAERAMLEQCAALLLQIETRQDRLVGGTVVDAETFADRSIRLSSEVRRLTVRLRQRATPEVMPQSIGPLRASLLRKPADEVPAVPDVIAKQEEPAT